MVHRTVGQRKPRGGVVERDVARKGRAAGQDDRCGVDCEYSDTRDAGPAIGAAPLRIRRELAGRADFVALRYKQLLRQLPCVTDAEIQALACDWMQCEARARYSPVHGEKLGTVNRDGTCYHTKSEALEQCAEDMVEFAEAVYGIDIAAPGPLSVRDLANAFAAFRWGGLLRLHRTSAMEFPYSVAGLTPQHTRMRWPKIADPNTPDRPGSRFRKPFGAVPIVLSLNYPATV